MTKQFATPGPRAIYPELCASPSLGRCSVLANALLPRLIAQADDQGRLVGDAQSVLIECMGRLLRLVSIDDVAGAVAELAREEVVQVYEAAGQEYLQLLGWWRWQASQRRAYPSRWPAPPGWRDLVYGTGKGDPDTFDEAVRSTPPRNAAIRGVSRQPAARATPARTGPRARAGAQAMPDRAVPDAVPSRDAAPPARGGAVASAGEVLSEFQAKVPRP